MESGALGLDVGDGLGERLADLPGKCVSKTSWVEEETGDAEKEGWGRGRKKRTLLRAS
jgi:hypothetical protein